MSEHLKSLHLWYDPCNAVWMSWIGFKVIIFPHKLMIRDLKVYQKWVFRFNQLLSQNKVNSFMENETASYIFTFPLCSPLLTWRHSLLTHSLTCTFNFCFESKSRIFATLHIPSINLQPYFLLFLFFPTPHKGIYNQFNQLSNFSKNLGMQHSWTNFHGFYHIFAIHLQK